MEHYSKRAMQVLRRLSDDSRASVSEIAKDLNCGRATAAKIIKSLEEKLNLKYTLEINEDLLKAGHRHLVTVSFAKKPSAETLEKLFKNEKDVHEAYVTEGDFDLLVYTSTNDAAKYITWETKLSAELAEYQPLVKTCEIAVMHFGFFPLNDEFVENIQVHEKIDETDKKMLVMLNKNSRIRVADISRKTGLRDSTVRYRLFRLKESGIIKRFTVVVQNPPERYPMAFFITYRFTKGANERMLKARKFLIEHDEEEKLLNPFQIQGPVSGSYRSFGFAIFENKEESDEVVMKSYRNTFKEDSAKIESARIVKAVKGLYPYRNESVRQHYQLIEWK